MFGSKWTIAAVAVLLTASVSQAQLIIVQSPPIYVQQPVVVYRPVPIVNIAYYPPAPVYVAARPVVAYSPPPAVVQVPVAGVYTTYSYSGYGVFRPRGVYTQSYYAPLR